MPGADFGLGSCVELILRCYGPVVGSVSLAQYRRMRAVLFALAALFLAAASPSGQQGQSQQPGNSNEIAASANGTEATVVEAAREQQTDTGCKAGQDRRESDLCAQWKAADAAHASAVWAEYTYWLGVVGLGIGFLTLLAAGAAAKFARDAATETKRGADAADNTLRSNRAWLVVDHPNFGVRHRPGQDPPPIVGLQVSLTLKNTGQSPAVSCGLSTTSRLAPFRGEPPLIEYEPPETLNAAVGQNQTISTHSIVIAGEDFARFIAHENDIVIHAIAVYTDVFGDTHETEVCMTFSFAGAELSDLNGGHAIISGPKGPQNRNT
jgi:hypothetical protein